MGFPAGAHRACLTIASSQTKSGCGAADAVEALTQLSQRHAQQISQLADSCAVATLPEGIASFPTQQGRKLVETIAAAGGVIDDLEGKHAEVAIVLNHRQGQVLNRAELARAVGRQLQVFLIDVWAFPQAAKVAQEVALHVAGAGERDVTFEAEQLRTQLCATMGSFTFAALLALCAPKMPVLCLP